MRALAERWREEAWRNTVFPLDDDGTLHAVRPGTEAPLSEPVELVPFRPPLERFRSARLTVLRSFEVHAELDLGPGAEGVLLAHGDQGGGYLLALDGGELLLSYNAYGAMRRVRTTAPGPGRHRIVLRVRADLGLRWSLALDVDGVERISLDDVPMLVGMAPFTGISVGYDYGGPVDWEIYERHRSFRFSGGRILSLRYVPGESSPEDATVLRAIEQEMRDLVD